MSDASGGFRARIVSIKIGAAVEPLQRSRENAGRCKDWLSNIGAYHWEPIGGIAAYFHPDYRPNPNRAHGAFLFRQMERGEFNQQAVKGLAPTLFERLPAKPRGIPIQYLEGVLFISACLVCYETAILGDSLKEKPVNGEKIFRHLYWIERFFRLWERTHDNPPRNRRLNEKKWADAGKWQDDLRGYHEKYLRGHPRAKTRSIVANFLRHGNDGPSFEHAYRWGLRNLKK